MAKTFTRALGAISAAVALGAAASANAVQFVGTDTISAYTTNNSNNGLNILISDPTDLSFNLSNVGDSTGYINLFRIYTDETALNFDDLTDQAFNIAFNFTQPVPGSTGGFDGVTDGDFHLLWSNGSLTWDTDTTFLNFGSGYQLKVKLQDASETFNAGFGTGLTPGYHHGADVKAKFVLTQVPTAAVPEPGTWALMIGGFGMAGAAIRRRRALSAIAA